MGKTGGNMEPMPFVRKFGPAAASDPAGTTATVPAPPDDSYSRKRSRSRSRGGDRDRDRRRSRRERSRSRDRSARRRSRSPPRRSRSRDRSSRDRSRRSRSGSRGRRRTQTPPSGPHISAKAPPGPVVNPLVRQDFVERSADEPQLQVALLDGAPPKRERKSRWSTTKSFVPGMPTILPSNLSDDQRDAYLLQLEIEDATRRLRLGDFMGDPSARSPSPEPIYDTNGKRLNTREIRKRQELEQLRHEKIQGLLKLNPNFKPPADYRAPNIRLHDKVWIPQDDHPEVNFVGLLIGPRGNTLKSLEAETGAKIIIRGKGSVKEGKLGSRQGPLPGENEPLHAYVTGTDQAVIKKGCEKIRSIINEALAIPDGQNELRKLQLRELALLNGTLRPEDLVSGARCSNCGSDEHKTWECPDAPNVTAKIVCTSCGGAGHIARDCRNPRPGFMEGGMGMDMGMDDEYSALMAELGEKPPPGSGGGGIGSGVPRGASTPMGMRGRGSFTPRGGATGGSFFPTPNRGGLGYQGRGGYQGGGAGGGGPGQGGPQGGGYGSSGGPSSNGGGYGGGGQQGGGGYGGGGPGGYGGSGGGGGGYGSSSGGYGGAGGYGGGGYGGAGSIGGPPPPPPGSGGMGGGPGGYYNPNVVSSRGRGRGGGYYGGGGGQWGGYGSGMPMPVPPPPPPMGMSAFAPPPPPPPVPQPDLSSLLVAPAPPPPPPQ